MWHCGAPPETHRAPPQSELGDVTSTDDNNDQGRGENTTSDQGVTATVDATPRARLPFPVVGIGASAGGIQALESFFSCVDHDSGMAPPGFTLTHAGRNG